MSIWANTLFYFVFLGQIILISYHLPERLLGRMRYVLETYPPSEYPKLYPKPIEQYERWHRAFKIVNRLIFGVGFIVLLAIMFVVDHASFADDGFISEVFPTAYGILQFVPLMLLELSELGHHKMMRKARSATTRRAELRRRRLFDFVSPVVLGVAVLLYLAAIVFDLYAHEFVFQWGQTAWLTVGVLFLVAVGAWQLYGRKLDPHQASGDRAKQIAIQLNSLLYVSMALNVFFMTVSADKVFDLDYLDATLVSLYFQGIVILSVGHVIRSLKVEDINFDVYKAETAVT